jgi:thiopeptide-type bacteriocin biosynthesis protein
MVELISPENEQLRWQAALTGADQLITDLGYAGSRKLELIQTVHAQLLAEFSQNRMLPVELNKKYRASEKIVHQSMTGTESALGPIFKIISRRTQEIAHILGSKSAAIKLAPSTVSSFVHMYLNRLFSSRSREQELVIYHYLNKYYKTITKHKM